MHNILEFKTYIYSGTLASACESFVREKRAVGCLYNTEAKRLSEFSRFALAFDCPENTLTKEIVQAWIAKRSAESDKNQYARFSLISQFAKYMERVGYSAYIPRRDEPPSALHCPQTAFDYARFIPNAILLRPSGI